MADDIRGRARECLRGQADLSPHDLWDTGYQNGFESGAEWGHAQPRTVTRAEVEKAARAAFERDSEAVPELREDEWDQAHDDLRDSYRDNQRAALAAVGITVEEGP